MSKFAFKFISIFARFRHLAFFLMIVSPLSYFYQQSMHDSEIEIINKDGTLTTWPPAIITNS